MKSNNKTSKFSRPYSPIPTLDTINMMNSFALLATNDDDDQSYKDDKTVQCSNRSSDPAKQQSRKSTVMLIAINPIRPTAIIMPTRHKALQTLCRQNNIHFKKVATKKLIKQVHYAILDSGATGHFLVEGAPVANKKKTVSPITITLPIGGKIQSTHTCNRNIPWLPHHVTEAHIFPGLAHTSP